jgi:carbohydrate-binding DOMON domain-containing protein
LLGVPADSPIRFAVGSEGVIEIAAPLAALSPTLGSGDRFNMRLVVSDGREDIALVPVQGPALLVTPDLPVPNVVLDLADPQHDDHGPGDYTYPTDGVFVPGVFDLTRVIIGSNDEDVIFRITIGGPINNHWGSPNGLSAQTLDVYVDVDGPSQGERLLLPGRNAAFTPEFAWDYVAWVEGWTPGIYRTGPEGPVEVDSELGVVTNPGQRRVTITIPRSLLPGDITSWSVAVVMLSQEGYPSAGVWRVRDVNPLGEQWRLGGAPTDTNHTRIIDFLWPAGQEPTQEAYLGIYPSSSEDIDALGPDDFPQVPMLPLGGGGG